MRALLTDLYRLSMHRAEFSSGLRELTRAVDAATA